MITNHFFNLIECYSEQGRCLFMGYELFGYASNLLPLICWGFLTIYVLGVLWNIMRRCLCSCGGLFFDIGSLVGLFISLLWPIVVIAELLFNFFEYITEGQSIGMTIWMKSTGWLIIITLLSRLIQNDNVTAILSGMMLFSFFGLPIIFSCVQNKLDEQEVQRECKKKRSTRKKR
jgi:hypothetical protein